MRVVNLYKLPKKVRGRYYPVVKFLDGLGILVSYDVKQSNRSNSVYFYVKVISTPYTIRISDHPPSESIFMFNTYSLDPVSETKLKDIKEVFCKQLGYDPKKY